MDNQIDLRIELDEEDLARDPLFLQNLERDLKREIRSPISHETRKPPEGAQGPEIIVAIELAKLAVMALGAIITMILVRYRGEITIEKELPDGRKVTVKKGKLTDAELRKELADLEQEAKADKIRKLFIKMTKRS